MSLQPFTLIYGGYQLQSILLHTNDSTLNMTHAKGITSGPFLFRLSI